MAVMFYQNPWFWALLSAVAFMAWGTVKKLGFTKIPFLADQSQWLLIGAAGFLITSGLLGTWGFGSVAATPVTAAVGSTSIADLQMTTSFKINGSAVLTESANVPDLIDVRLNNSHGSSNTVNDLELSTGILTVTRTGNLAPMSCSVVAKMPPVFENETLPDGRTFNIVAVNSLGDYSVYVKSGGAAGTSDPKMRTSLSFADGASTGTLGIAFDVDSNGYGFLNSYSKKDVVIDVCGKPYTFSVWKIP